MGRRGDKGHDHERGGEGHNRRKLQGRDGEGRGSGPYPHAEYDVIDHQSLYIGAVKVAFQPQQSNHSRKGLFLALFLLLLLDQAVNLYLP
ncbi:hypothetical protein SCA6_011105 [Theobroma cacao]